MDDSKIPGKAARWLHENQAKVDNFFGCRGLPAYLLGLMKKVQPFDLRF